MIVRNKVSDSSDEMSQNNETQMNNNFYFDIKLLPEGAPIQENQHSLVPDMYNGWRPKQWSSFFPIPLKYKNTISNHFYENGQMQNEKYQIQYIGERYQDSHYFHEANKKSGSQYEFKQLPLIDNLRHLNQNKSKNFQYSLKFDSNFESGNLDFAIQKCDTEYDLFMRVDTNSKGHFQWFYFKVQNMNMFTKYKFNIVNFKKKKSLYERGAKPFILSQINFQKYEKSWQQLGENVQYFKTNTEYITDLYPDKQLHTLSFIYQPLFNLDTVSFAFCIPYTFSMLRQHIKEWKILNKTYIKETKLCTSLAGISVPLLTIENPDQKNQYCIIVQARIHPGESNSSFVMKGFIDHLIKQETQQQITFKIVPMLNVDGVIFGNYRTGVLGKDLNRQFHTQDKHNFSEILAIKNLVQECKRDYHVLCFIDLHGHSIKKNIFSYGPDFPIFDMNYYKCRIIPKLISNYTNMFRFYSCTFTIKPSKKSTARAIIQQDIPNSFTIESSNGLFYDIETKLFDQKYWEIGGKNILLACQQYQRELQKLDESKQLECNNDEQSIIENQGNNQINRISNPSQKRFKSQQNIQVNKKVKKKPRQIKLNQK